MPSAVTETTTWESSVIAPVGSDVMSATGIRDMAQDVANRTKWLKESGFRIQAVSSAQDTQIINGLAYANFSGNPGLTFTNVKAGDEILVCAQINVDVTGSGADVSFNLRWVDGGTGLQSPTGVSARQFVGSASGAQSHHISLIDYWSVGADAASLVLRPQSRVIGTNPQVTVDGDLVMYSIHFRRGQT